MAQFKVRQKKPEVGAAVEDELAKTATKEHKEQRD